MEEDFVFWDERKDLFLKSSILLKLFCVGERCCEHGKLKFSRKFVILFYTINLFKKFYLFLNPRIFSPVYFYYSYYLVYYLSINELHCLNL